MTTQAGVIFTVDQPRPSWALAVAHLKAAQPKQIEHPNRSEFDTRRPSDVMVMKFANVVAICNDEIASPMLKDPTLSCEDAYQALGRPRYMQYFLWYDTGESYGYGIVLDGQRVRTRLELAAIRVTDYGALLNFEKPWLEAPVSPRSPDDFSNYLQQTFHGKPGDDECLKVKTLPDGRWCYVSDLTRAMLAGSFDEKLGFQPFQNDAPAHEYEFYQCV